jgi:hypothetical protein
VRGFVDRGRLLCRCGPWPSAAAECRHRPSHAGNDTASGVGRPGRRPGRAARPRAEPGEWRTDERSGGRLEDRRGADAVRRLARPRGGADASRSQGGTEGAGAGSAARAGGDEELRKRWCLVERRRRFVGSIARNYLEPVKLSVSTGPKTRKPSPSKCVLGFDPLI